jgi:hypothetical protein
MNDLTTKLLVIKTFHYFYQNVGSLRDKPQCHFIPCAAWGKLWTGEKKKLKRTIRIPEKAVSAVGMPAVPPKMKILFCKQLSYPAPAVDASSSLAE